MIAPKRVGGKVRIEPLQGNRWHQPSAINSNRRRINRPPELERKGWLWSQYVTERRTATAISKMLGVTVDAVRQALRRHGVTRLIVREGSARSRIRTRRSEEARQSNFERGEA